MTASAGAWYRVGTVNVTKNNQTVTGVATNWQNDVIAIAVGDIFTLDAKTWYEVTAVASDTSITLDRGFEGATGAGQSYAIVRNTSGTILTRIAGQVSVQFNQKQLFLDELRTWLNSTNASEELTDSHGLKRSLKTPAQMVADHDNRLAELDEIHPYPWAMRKVEFEARRAANNEKFAASGFVHFGQSFADSVGSIYQNISEGLYTNVASGFYTNSLILGAKVERTNPYKSRDYHPTVNISGVTTQVINLTNTSEALLNKVKLPPAEGGTRTYDSATGVSVTHTTSAIAFASETATNKVVTDRVDMWGLEAYLREVSDADPFVYAKGLIQSLASKINGVTTVSDNVRPITYFAWYEGDEDSRGRGVNWQTASEANRIKIASDPANNVYFDDETGKFYQWCVRGRSFAGASNGGWDNLDVMNLGGNSSVYLEFQRSKNSVKPQGKKSTASYGGWGYPIYTANVGADLHSKKATGVFGAKRSPLLDDDTAGENGECYFLVCGTVNRLNQGAYHPSFNPKGSSTFRSAEGLGHRLWHHGDIVGNISSPSQCFGYLAGDAGADIVDGSLSSAFSGRTDGRFYDAIYASGEGGVCRDMRYSSWGLKPEDFKVADQEVKSGAYRGNESIPIFKLGKPLGNLYLYAATNKRVIVYGLGISETRKVYPDDIIWFKPEGADTFYPAKITKALPTYLELELFEGYPHPMDNGVAGSVQMGADFWYPHRDEVSSLSSTYTHLDVLGDPNNIVECPDLKHGWPGSWITAIPDGTNQEYALTRKSLATQGDRIYSNNLGLTWAKTTVAIDPVPNSHTYTGQPTRVEIWQYSTKARITTTSTYSPLYYGEESIGSVWGTSTPIESFGQGLHFSLTGGIAKNSNTQSMTASYPLQRFTIKDNLLDVYSLRLPTHQAYNFNSSFNSSTTEGLKGVKALNCATVVNNQAFINYIYTELVKGGVTEDWGDDGVLKIVNNQSTMLDTNGNTVKVGIARIVEPLGWIKNDK